MDSREADENEIERLYCNLCDAFGELESRLTGNMAWDASSAMQTIQDCLNRLQRALKLDEENGNG